jgi:UDP-glucose 4-epimerase
MIFSGIIGEDPRGVPNNLVPYIARVAAGQYPFVRVYGNDFPTVDGTGIRDYVHVCDIASGHILALMHLLSISPKFLVFNLGTGIGYSVLDMITAVSKASGKEIPYKFCPRRTGDVASVYANYNKAKAVLGWEPKRTLKEMCQDLWKWQHQNPDGYAPSSS